MMSMIYFVILLILLFVITYCEAYRNGMDEGFKQGRKFDPLTSQDRFNEILLDRMETKGMLTGAKYKDAMREAEELSGWRAR